MSLNFCSWLWLPRLEKSQLPFLPRPEVSMWRPMLASSSGALCGLTVKINSSDLPDKEHYFSPLISRLAPVPPSPRLGEMLPASPETSALVCCLYRGNWQGNENYRVLLVVALTWRGCCSMNDTCEVAENLCGYSGVETEDEILLWAITTRTTHK